MMHFRHMMQSKIRLALLLIALLIALQLFYTAPPPPGHTSSISSATPPVPALPQCNTRKTFGELANDSYIIFIKPRFGDAATFSNMFFYLGLKYGKYFAINIDRPLSWHGLAEGVLDSSYLQLTKEPPKIISQEFSYQPSSIDRILPGYQTSNKIVLAFLRDPFEVFMSCLQRKLQNQRGKKDGISLMLDDNVNKYLEQFSGNLKAGKQYIWHNGCLNVLSYSLGLNDDMYKRAIIHGENVTQNFVELVERRITDFIIFERQEESVFYLTQKHCLQSDHDFLYLRKLRETYVGSGFGKLSAQTMATLKHYLQFDYAIYEHVLAKFDAQFMANKNQVDFHFVDEFQDFKQQLKEFINHCCYDTISMVPQETAARSYGLTKKGEEDIQCRLIHGSNMVLANMVFQLQEFNLTRTVNALIERKAPYGDFLSVIEKTLGEEEEEV